KVKICLKGSRTYKDFILNLKQKIDTIQSQYEIERVRLEVGYGEELSGIEIIGKNGMDISLISEYSKNILKRIAKNSNNPVVVITDVSRTPLEQAKTMYNLIEANGVMHVKNNVYSHKVHSVINIYDDLKKESKPKEYILNHMEQEIRVLIPKGYFQHCQDPNIKNTFDVSVRSLKNQKEFFRAAEEYKNIHQGFHIIDERRNQAPCYHIEITQP
ncbi:hypothetical protein, partial [Helicobacter cinaedi]